MMIALLSYETVAITDEQTHEKMTTKMLNLNIESMKDFEPKNLCLVPTIYIYC